MHLKVNEVFMLAEQLIVFFAFIKFEKTLNLANSCLYN